MAEVVVDVALEERYWYPDDGGVVWVAGFQPVGADGRYLARDAPELAVRGLLSVNVAGAAFVPAAVLADDAFSPGRPLVLRRDPANEHDPNAIAVHSADERALQAGWVPREAAADLAPRLDAGEAFSAVVLRERRASPRDPRTGLVALLAPGPIVLREV